MKRRDQRALGEYVRWVANELGLRDWTFNLVHSHDEEDDAYATCTPTFGRKCAKIELCHDFRALPAAEQRHAVVHELLHCHFAAAQDAVRLNLPRQLSQQGYDLFYEHYRQAQEYAVDGVADGIAGRLPLIRWPK